MLRIKLGLGLFSCIAIAMALSSQANAQIVFDFNDETDFDNGQGINATSTVTAGDGSSATLTIVDLFAPEFVNNLPTANVLRASQGSLIVTQIDSNTLGVDNPSVADDDFFPDATGNGAGIENRDINDREGLVFQFDVPVIFREIDFASLDAGVANVTVEGIGSFNFVDDETANPGDIFLLPFGADFIPAGANITILFSSPAAADANLRISQFTVTTSTDFLTRPTFDFNEETEFDNGQGVGATTVATSLDGSSTVTLSIVDLFAPEFVGTVPSATILRASQGAAVVTQIGSNSLGVDNPSVTDADFFAGAGQENRDINDGEGLVFQFDVPVTITELALVSLDESNSVTVEIEGVGSFSLTNDVDNPSDDFSLPFGTDLIPAGADITISYTTNLEDTDANVRIQEITVSTEAVSVLLGDANCDGVVNFLDITPFIAFLTSGQFKAQADIDGNGVINFLDITPFIAILTNT